MTRYTILEQAGWRRPVIAAVEECYDVESTANGMRDVRWIVDGPDQFEVLRRMAAGEVCSHCLEPMPERPSLSAVRRFGEVYGDKPEPIASRWRERVSRGCCPVCGTEVSPAYFDALYRGVLPPIPDIPDAE